MMALTLPNLTWELLDPIVLSIGDDANEHLTELKSAITGTSDSWRVLDDDIGAGDSYLWIAGPVGSPVADMRIFYWLSKAVTAVHADNRSPGAPSTNAAGVVWVGLSPDDGTATPNATDPTAATDVFNSRSTGLSPSGYWDYSTTVDRMQLVSSDEVILWTVWPTGAGTTAWHTLCGPFVAPSDDAGGESGDNGRIYGVATSGSTGQANFDFTNDGSFLCASSATTTTCRVHVMDPASPSNCIQAKSITRCDSNLTDTTSLDQMVEKHGATDVRVHMPIQINAFLTPFKRLGRMRQIRMTAGDDDRYELRSGGSGPAKSIIYAAWFGSTQSSALAFDNDGV